MQLHGNLVGLGRNETKRLKALTRRRVPTHRFLTQELAREITGLSRELSRQVGVLLDRSGHVVVALVGDGDSARRVPAGLERVDYSSDKDFSDLSGALREARSRGVRVAVLAGLAGGRLDHEWINLQEAGAHAHAFDGLVAPTLRGMLVVTAAGCRLETRPGRTVSLLVLGGSARVSLTGTRWTLRQTRLRPGSRGLSNVTGERLRLQVHAGVAALIFP